MNIVKESIKWHPTIVVSKWNPDTVRQVQADLMDGIEPCVQDFERLGIKADDFAYADGNLLVTTGSTRIAQLITGVGGTVAFNAAQGYVGVGDGSASPTTVGMTDLQGTNKYYVPLATGPSLSGGTISVTANYGSSVANFAWNEWCFGIAASTNAAGTAAPTGVMLNRKPQALGTKANGATWTITAALVIA